MNRLLACCVAEFIGTFALIFFGAGSIVMAAGAIGGHRLDPLGSLTQIALAHGLVLFVFISGAMYLSGGQFNPAVSIGLVVAGVQPAARAAVYIVAQLVGGCVGAWVLLWAVPEANLPPMDLGATVGALTTPSRAGALVVCEAIGAFSLMLAVLAATVDSRAAKLGGLVIGMTVTVCILAIGPLTGASMNPARSLGPALVGRHWDMHWAYWVGPILGACLGAVVYRVFWIKEAGPAAP